MLGRHIVDIYTGSSRHKTEGRARVIRHITENVYDVEFLDETGVVYRRTLQPHPEPKKLVTK